MYYRSLAYTRFPDCALSSIHEACFWRRMLGLGGFCSVPDEAGDRPIFKFGPRGQFLPINGLAPIAWVRYGITYIWHLFCLVSI